eukprot:scaffold181389_cov20-Tisochrysis_lutea.AAC.2
MLQVHCTGEACNLGSAHGCAHEGAFNMGVLQGQSALSRPPVLPLCALQLLVTGSGMELCMGSRCPC